MSTLKTLGSNMCHHAFHCHEMSSQSSHGYTKFKEVGKYNFNRCGELETFKQSFRPHPSIIRKQADKTAQPYSPKPTSGVAKDNKHGRTSCRVMPRTMENYALGHVPEYELFVTGPK